MDSSISRCSMLALPFSVIARARSSIGIPILWYRQIDCGCSDCFTRGAYVAETGNQSSGMYMEPATLLPVAKTTM
jgi:hypothetical protein